MRKVLYGVVGSIAVIKSKVLLEVDLPANDRPSIETHWIKNLVHIFRIAWIKFAILLQIENLGGQIKIGFEMSKPCKIHQNQIQGDTESSVGEIRRMVHRILCI